MNTEIKTVDVNLLGLGTKVWVDVYYSKEEKKLIISLSEVGAHAAVKVPNDSIRLVGDVVKPGEHMPFAIYEEPEPLQQ